MQYGDTYIIKEWPSFNALLEGYYAEKDRAERLRTKSKELHKAVHNMYELSLIHIWQGNAQQHTQEGDHEKQPHACRHREDEGHVGDGGHLIGPVSYTHLA